MGPGIIQSLPSGLEKAVTGNLSPGETVIYKLKGAFKEALVCTDRRVLIIKAGFMTGQIFGSDAFQLPYPNIASAQVKFHLLTGFFEVSAGGVQNMDKSYWSRKPGRDAARAPNSVALSSRQQADWFREAASYIMRRISEAKSGAPTSPATTMQPADDVSASIDRLWSLKEKGALSQAEFEAAKAKLLV